MVNNQKHDFFDEDEFNWYDDDDAEDLKEGILNNLEIWGDTRTRTWHGIYCSILMMIGLFLEYILYG